MKMFKHTSKGAAVAALVGLLTACGSGGTDSGLPADKPGGELTADEEEQLCDGFTESATTAVDGIDNPCVGGGYFLAALYFSLGASTDEADLQAVCMGQQTYCEDAEAEPTEPMCPPLTEDCESTVGELETCFDAQLDLTVATFSPEEDCETLSVDGLEAYMADVEAVTGDVNEACEDVATSCPGFVPEPAE